MEAKRKEEDNLNSHLLHYFVILFNVAKLQVTFMSASCVDHNKLWKILKEMEIPDHLTCLLKICMWVRKQQLELDMKQGTGSK